MSVCIYLYSMAFQAGDIKISGTLDELSFYHSVFGWLVRTKGGPTRRQFKNSPAFARSRENSDEFTACAKTASSIRRLILTRTGHKDKTLYHRLIKLMRLLANYDAESLRGKRDPLKGMQTVQGQGLLKDFGVAGNLHLYEILHVSGFIKQGQEVKITGRASIAVRRRQKKALYVFYPHSQVPQKHTNLSHPRKQARLNTAFG